MSELCNIGTSAIVETHAPDIDRAEAVRCQWYYTELALGHDFDSNPDKDFVGNERTAEHSVGHCYIPYPSAPCTERHLSFIIFPGEL